MEMDKNERLAKRERDQDEFMNSADECTAGSVCELRFSCSGDTTARVHPCLLVFAALQQGEGT